MQDPQQSAIIGKYAVAPLTRNKTSRTTAVCHARGINLFSEKQDAAWEYVKYVTSPEQLLSFFQAVVADVRRSLPHSSRPGRAPKA